MSRFLRFKIRMLGFAVAMSALAVSTADASFISTSPDPILGGNLVSSGAPISSPFGYVTFTITNVVETSNNIVGTNDFVEYTASPILTFYADPSLTTVLTSATFQGQFEIEIMNRSTPFETGTFNFQFISSTASGLVGGVPVSVQLDPSQTSGGSTTITPGPGAGYYTIDTSAVQYSQFSVSGDPFVSIPANPLVGVTPIPEPTSLTMLGTAIAGLFFIRSRRAV